MLAIYENKVLDELVIYGSSRLGSYNGKTDQGKRTLGNKKYELSNHLGNVLAVISDNKIGIGTNGVADYYEPLVISESDYYPFGMAMKERSFSNQEYRFGFNTQEKSTKLGEDTYTAEFWQYDGKIARRWNNDPRPNTSISVYAAFAGNPLLYSDHFGDTTFIYNKEFKRSNANYLKDKDKNNDWNWDPVPDETIKENIVGTDRENVYLYEHDQGTIERNGKKYVEIWSDYSLRGHDYFIEGTDNLLIDNFESKFFAYFKKEGLDDAWGMTIHRESYGGLLDIAYNEFLRKLTIDNKGKLGKWGTKTVKTYFGLSSEEKPVGGYSNSLFLIGGRYANANEAGNFAIGYGRGYNEVTSGGSWADYYSQYQEGRNDDPHEAQILNYGKKRGDTDRPKD